MPEITGKLRKSLNNNIWYHGTFFSSWGNICENGILANYNIDKSQDLDFGFGFYLAPTFERAERYIIGLLTKDPFISKDEQPIILGFEFNPLEWFESDTYITKAFPTFDDEFALFVFDNRTENLRGSKQHNYDVIYGVMSDSVPTISILEYQMGRKSKEDVLADLKVGTSMKQISLHKQELCDIIKLKEAYILDKETGERKELDINDYSR
ncbi:MAG: hypothetical protein K0R92_786 [Lachnospiraceae bacterium]|nr:hypothetical protein [Lachnospiraceae bacterium]